MDTAQIIPEFNFCLSTSSFTAWELLWATRLSQALTINFYQK